MATTTTPRMHSLMITEDERAELMNLLAQALGETRIEMHRTHTPEFRDRVMGEESLLRCLLEKFRGLGS